MPKPIKSFEDSEKEAAIEYYSEIDNLNPYLVDRLPEWLRNFKHNLETVGFRKSLEDLPPIKGSALIVDHPFSGNLEKHLETLKKYKGTVLACDRALYKIIPYRIPEYVVQIDSHWLCTSFFDRPDVRLCMDKVTALFSTMTHTLTIRAWTGKRVFFNPMLGWDILDETLRKMSKCPSIYTGGCVHNTAYVIAAVLKANPIGLLGVENSYTGLRQTEYPDVHHDVITNRFGRFYTDPVYKYYDRKIKELANKFKKNYGLETYNCSEGGITYEDGVISHMKLEDFIKYGKT